MLHPLLPVGSSQAPQRPPPPVTTSSGPAVGGGSGAPLPYPAQPQGMPQPQVAYPGYPQYPGYTPYPAVPMPTVYNPYTAMPPGYPGGECQSCPCQNRWDAAFRLAAAPALTNPTAPFSNWIWGCDMLYTLNK